MFLEELHLINYKSILQQDFHFKSKINCFVGENGIGKTNILDAIYYLANGKSYFNPIASQNINHSADFFMIDGVFNTPEKKEHITASLKKNQKKVLKRNGKPYEKMADHFGRIPLVMISPSDEDLISEGSDRRRKFIDMVISQQDTLYLQDLMAYNKVLSQRNALLKYFAANRTFDAPTLQIYDEQLNEYAQGIYKKRGAFLKEFVPIFEKYHQIITNNKEKVNLIYESHLADGTLLEILQDHLKKDRMLQYTSVGIHKDDLHFMIQEHPIKKFGSQGQKKSLLIALKLAQFDFLKSHSGELPILLFDDIFDKLDAQRVKQIIELVHTENFGQLFISDTHRQRTELLVADTQLQYEIFEIGTTHEA